MHVKLKTVAQLAVFLASGVYRTAKLFPQFEWAIIVPKFKIFHVLFVVLTLMIFQIVGYVGPVVIIVSCVTMDEPFRAHPHKLVGKEGCKDGICTVRIDIDDNMTKTFTNLGIQCVTKREIRESLAVREKKFIDPFKSEWILLIHLIFDAFYWFDFPPNFSFQRFFNHINWKLRELHGTSIDGDVFFKREFC